jgi:DNA-directed RNA polymerase subunit M/transcription elongation factor TFIIS
MSKPKLADSELVIRCPHCGRCAPLTPRMMNANKTLVCSQCGTRQRLRVYQITDALYREHERLKKAAKAAKPKEPKQPPLLKQQPVIYVINNSDEAKGTLH